MRMAAQCCKLTDTMITRCDHLWTVPQRLIEQARQKNTKNGHVRKIKNSISPITIIRNSGGGDAANQNANHVHKTII